MASLNEDLNDNNENEKPVTNLDRYKQKLRLNSKGKPFKISVEETMMRLQE